MSETQLDVVTRHLKEALEIVQPEMQREKDRLLGPLETKSMLQSQADVIKGLSLSDDEQFYIIDATKALSRSVPEALGLKAGEFTLEIGREKERKLTVNKGALERQIQEILGSLIDFRDASDQPTQLWVKKVGSEIGQIEEKGSDERAGMVREKLQALFPAHSAVIDVTFDGDAGTYAVTMPRKELPRAEFARVVGIVSDDVDTDLPTMAHLKNPGLKIVTIQQDMLEDALRGQGLELGSSWGAIVATKGSRSSVELLALQGLSPKERVAMVQQKLYKIFPEHADKIDVAFNPVTEQYSITMPNELRRIDFADAVGLILDDRLPINRDLPGHKHRKNSELKIVTIDQERFEQALSVHHDMDFSGRETGSASSFQGVDGGGGRY